MNPATSSSFLVNRLTLPSSRFLEKTREILENGAVVLIDKSPGWTSFDAVNKIRRATKVRKVGHCGTLDPFATGLLVIVTGRATRQASIYSGESKGYEAEFFLGRSTDTLDLEGLVTEERTVQPYELSDLRAACQSFLGTINQVPPAYSAVKIGGTPAHRLARKGKQVLLDARQVVISKFEIINYNHPILHCIIECSKGTYIRALARDIGALLGCGAFVQSLRRFRSGDFCVEDSITVNQFIEATVVKS